MLQAIRDKMMGWIGWVIIGLIIITFALVGLGSYLQDKNQVYSAKVNDVEISPRELQNAYQQQRAQLQQMLGDNYDPDLISEAALRQRALNNLISRALLVQGADNAGMAISDQLLAAQIHAIPAFQENGVFSDERYQRLLAQQGISPSGFEADTRNDLLADQLVSGISRSGFVTPYEVELAYALQYQKRDFSYALIAAEPYEANVQVTDAEIQDYVERHRDELMLPERVRLEYVRLTADQLVDDMAVDEEELQALYEQKQESMKSLEQRRASHILIEVPADAGDDAVEEARQEAEALLARIREGEDFSALASEHSDDPGSAESGGDLGFITAGAMVPEFEKTVFDLEQGEVSEPVRTQFGFHLIKVTEIKREDLPPLEQMRDELAAQLKQQRIDDLFYEQLERLTDLSYESPGSLDVAAEELGLEIQTSDWITAGGGPGIGAYPEVLSVAFSDDVLEAGNNSEPVETGHGDAVVVRVAEREPPHLPPIESIREEIVERLKTERARQQARETGEALLERLEQGAAIADLQEKENITVGQAEAVERSTPGYNPEVLRAAFRLPRPAPGDNVEHGIQLMNGDYALIQLTDVTDGDPANMQPEERRQIVQGYESLRQASNLTTLVESLRTRADVDVPSAQED